MIASILKSTKEDDVMDSELDGKMIPCPVCNEETVMVRLNKRGKPVVTCHTYGSAMNFNTDRGIERIWQLVRETKDNDSWDHQREEKGKDDDW